MRVLISDSTSYKSIVIAKYIKTHYKSVKVYTCSNIKITSKIHTKYSDGHFLISALSYKDESYLDRLVDLVEKLQIDVYIPVNSVEMDILIKKKERLGKTLSYWGNYEQFIILNDKNNLCRLAKSINIKMPIDYTTIEQARIPFVLKPAISSSAKGVLYIKKNEELKKLLSAKLDFSQYIIQEYIEGKGIGYSVFAVNGKISTGYGHLRLAEYPVTGGSSVYRDAFIHPEMIKTAEKILDHTKWSGFCMFEFKITDNSQIYLIEINPRVWGSINQGLQNGVNYFSALFGNTNSSIKNSEIKTYLSPLVYISLFMYALKGEWIYLNRFVCNFRKNRADVSITNDPLGFASMLLKIL